MTVVRPPNLKKEAKRLALYVHLVRHARGSLRKTAVRTVQLKKKAHNESEPS